MAYRKVRFFKALAEYATRRRNDPHFQKYNWPTCDLCGGAQVDSVEMADMGKRHCTIRARHHGSDDAIECLFDWDITEVDLSIPLRGQVFFKPGVDEDRVISSYVKNPLALGTAPGSQGSGEGSDGSAQGGGSPSTP